MRKRKAIQLLELQKQKIKDNKTSREDWLASARTVLLRVFPQSAALKIAQLENINKNPEYFQNLTDSEKIRMRKGLASNYISNYREEVELFGLESPGNSFRTLFRSLRVWILVIAVALISFIAGSSTQEFAPIFSSEKQEVMDYIEMQEKVIDSLQQEANK